MPNVRGVEPNVTLDNKILNIDNAALFLGVNIDSKLQWGTHIKVLSGKLSSAAYAVRKIRQLTDIATARLVYFAYFHSLMSYGILLWGSAADIETIFILQKRAIRAIYGMSPRESLRDLFRDINILTLASLYIYENIMYVRKNIKKVKLNSDCHSLNTRNKDKLAVPGFRLAKTRKSFLGNCVCFYNKIPKHVTQLTEGKFKRCVKAVLLKKAYYKVNDYIEDKDAWKILQHHHVAPNGETLNVNKSNIVKMAVEKI